MNRIPEKYILYGLAIIYAVGITGLSSQRTHDVFVLLIPLNIILSNILLFSFHQEFKFRFILTAILIAVLGFFIEVAGVETGLIFGTYQYGNSLSIKVLNVPVLIGINWLFMVYTSCVTVQNFQVPTFLKIAMAAFMMVFYDLALEPSAIALDMWSWQDGIIPIKNYLAWFGVGFMFSALFLLVNKKIENKIAPYLFFSQFIFFIFLNTLR